MDHGIIPTVGYCYMILGMHFAGGYRNTGPQRSAIIRIDASVQIVDSAARSFPHVALPPRPGLRIGGFAASRVFG